MSEKEKAMSLKIRGAPHLLGVGQITIEVGGEDITNSIKKPGAIYDRRARSQVRYYNA